MRTSLLTPWLRVVLAAAFLLGSRSSAPARDDAPSPDPVLHLEHALKAPLREAREREALLAPYIAALQGLNDYRRALLLPHWRDQAAEDPFAAVDRKQRAVLVGRFVMAMRQSLQVGQLPDQLDLLGVLATLEVRDTDGIWVSRHLTPDVIALTRRPLPALREAATRVLGQMQIDPRLAVPALAELLGDSDPVLRATVASALVGLAQRANQNALTGDRDGAVEACRLLVPVAAGALGDTNSLVRMRCVEALGRSTEVLSTLVPPPVAPEDPESAATMTRQVDEETTRIWPLVAALRDQTAAVAKATGDAEPRIRLLARQTLEDIAEVRIRLLNRTSGVLGLRAGSAVAEAQARLVAFVREDPLRQGLVEALPALTAGLSDPDVRARRAAVDVLETLGPAAASAGPALVTALSDSDRFVRWAAARALGKVKPASTAPVVAHLARLLSDSDPNLRVAAATTLRDYGIGARAALPELLEAARSTDGELRLAVLRALEGLGTEESAALAAIGSAINDSDARVRRQAADTLLRVSRKGTPEKAVGSAAKP